MKVAIIGGGPGGSNTALSLLSKGYDVDVLIFTENLNMPTRCGGALNRFVSSENLPTIPKEPIGASIRKARIYSPNGSFWEVDCKTFGYDSMAYILHRSKFDRRLLDRAERLGAEVIEEKVTLKKLKALDYDVLVGADGVYSTVSKFVGRSPLKVEDLHHGIQITVDWDYPRDTIAFYFGSTVAPEGYGWVFPCGDKTRIGLCVPLSRYNPKKLLDKILLQIGAPKEGELISKLIPMAKPPETGVYGNVLLVGDTLPACDPFVGGGIINAITTGNMAGLAIGKGDLPYYDVLWKKALYRRNSLRFILKNVLYGLTDNELDKMVEVMRGFQLKSVNIGMEMIKISLRLALRQPRLMLRLLSRAIQSMKLQHKV